MDIIITKDGEEVIVEWTCPKCNITQQDSVHPDLGPWLSCCCSNCEQCFEFEELSEKDQIVWDEACEQAAMIKKERVLN